MSKVDYEKVWAEASNAFRQAYGEVNPPKFVVGDAVGLSDEIDYSKPTYVMEGLCGFAWVNVGDGRSAWVKWLKAQGYARQSYYGGFDVWSSRFAGDHSQSIDRKEAGCRAAAEVFRSYGFKAYVGSRLD